MKRKNQNHIAPAVVAAAPAAKKIVGDVLGKVGDVAKDVGYKIGVGGVKDDRYNATRDEINAALTNAGYAIGKNGAPSQKQFKATAADAPNNAASNEPMFNRYHRFLVSILNHYNPGLGDKFNIENPVRMANAGQVKREYIEYAKAAVNAYKPGTFKPSFTDVTNVSRNQNQGTGFVTQGRDVLAENVAILLPLQNVMMGGLLAAGIVPKKETDLLAEQFYNEIVAKSTGQFQTDNLDDAITNSILSFIATVKTKYDEGEKMNPVYTRIAELTGQVQNKIQQQAKTVTGNTIGNWIIDNPVISIIGLLVIGLILAKLFKAF